MSDEWTLHATGVLTPATVTAPGDLTEWPPGDALEFDIEGVYERLAAQGFALRPGVPGLARGYGGAARTSSPRWSCPRGNGRTAGFTLHPALLDAALHPLLPGVVTDAGAEVLPFAWTGVGRARIRRLGAASAVAH